MATDVDTFVPTFVPTRPFLYIQSRIHVGMGQSRTNMAVVAVIVIGAVLMIELSGLGGMQGFSPWAVVGMIPAWAAAPILLGMGALWYLDPEVNARRPRR